MDNVLGLVRHVGSFACVNDAKVTDHHAIIPTQTPPNPKVLSLQEKQVFDLIARRFMAAFMPPLEYEATTIWVEVKGERFKATGRILKNKGWLEAEPWRKAQNNPLPDMRKGEWVQILNLEVVAKKTTPPAEYTDESLLGIMETAGKEVTDPQLRAALKDKGLGTPATRAQIIETLIQRGYVQRVNKKLVATDKGLEVARISEELIPQVVSPQMTGEWEQKLGDIARGRAEYTQFKSDISRFVSDIVTATRDKTIRYNAPLARNSGPASKEVIGTCPLCGGDVLETKKSFGCANWRSTGCRFALWKTSFGGRIGKRAARQLLQTGKTKQELKLQSKAGKAYTARLSLDEKGVLKPVFTKEDTTRKT